MQISLRRNKDEKEFRLEKFVREQSDKIRRYLQNRYSLSEDEFDDVFQESLIILWKNISEQKVDAEGLGMSSSTYFMTICRNKTMELLRSKSKYITTPYEINPSNEHYSFQEEQVERILSLDSENEKAQNEKEALVRDILTNLPSPCNELLWGYYDAGHSMRMLAEMFNYASENAVKVTKHRCCEKFRKRYKERMKSLF